METGNKSSAMIALIYRHAVGSTDERSLLKQLTQILAAKSGWVWAHDFRAGESKVYEFNGLDGAYVESYVTQYAKLNPWLKHQGWYSRPGTVVTGRDIVKRQDLVKTEFYAGWLEPQGLRHRIAGVLSVDGTRITDAGLEELKDWKHLKELRISYTMVTDAGLRHLRERTDLTSLNVGGPKITNEGLAHLKGLVNLYWLLIDGSQVTDAGLKHLSGMTDLQYLWIQKTQISDGGLAHLAGMNKLQSLWLLDNAAITDAGLEHLKNLRNLTSVTLQGTKVTQAGVDKLKAALPMCEIAYP